MELPLKLQYFNFNSSVEGPLGEKQPDIRISMA
jgi:hypothetical protein